MKFSATLFVPLVLATFAVAAPADSAKPSEGPKDQGGLKPVGNESPKPKANEESSPLDAVKGALPVNAIKGALPIDVVKSHLPVHKMRRVRSSNHARAPTSETVECKQFRVDAQEPGLSGVIASDLDKNGRYIVTKNAPAMKGTLKDHIITPSNANAFPAVGGTFGYVVQTPPGKDNFAGNSYNFAMLTRTTKTSSGQPAQNGGSSFNTMFGTQQHVESAIFSLGENNEIVPSWVNTDGSTQAASFGVNEDKQIIFSGNIGTYNAQVGGGKAARVFCETA